MGVNKAGSSRLGKATTIT